MRYWSNLAIFQRISRRLSHTSSIIRGEFGYSPVTGVQQPPVIGVQQPTMREEPPPTEGKIEENWWTRIWRGSTPACAAAAQSALVKHFVKKVSFWEKLVQVELEGYGTQLLATVRFEPNTVSSADATPLVMTHGFGSGTGMFYRNFEDLTTRLDAPVFAVDWLGMGRSSRPTFPVRSAWSTDLGENEVDPIAINFFLDALEEWRIKMGVEKMNLLGHSWGGYLSTLYAQKYPSRVNQLLLVSPFGVPEPPPLKPETEKPEMSWKVWMMTKIHQHNYTPHSILHTFGPWGHGIIKKAVGMRFQSKLDPDEIDLVAGYLYHVNAPEISGGLSLSAFSRLVVHGEVGRGLYAREPAQKHLVCTNIPTTIFYGDKDWMLSMTPQVADIVTQNPDYLKLHIIPSAGHHLYIDNAPVFNELVVQTLAQVHVTVTLP